MPSDQTGRGGGMVCVCEVVDAWGLFAGAAGTVGVAGDGVGERDGVTGSSRSHPALVIAANELAAMTRFISARLKRVRFMTVRA
jgi:hypothetical protein